MNRRSLLFFVALTAVSLTMGARMMASESDNLMTKADSVALYSQYLKLDADSLLTDHVFAVDFNLSKDLYRSDSLHAGLIRSKCRLIGEIISDSVNLPVVEDDDHDARNSFRTIYGKEYLTARQLDVKHDIWQWLVFKPYKRTLIENSTSVQINQGGVYVSETVFGLLGYNRNDTVIVYDEPSIRVIYDSSITVGNAIMQEAHFNTGYPYNPDSFTGEEKMKVKFCRAIDDYNMIQFDSREYPFRVKGTDHPLLAVIDTVRTVVADAEPARYVFDYESDWTAMKPHRVVVDVNDTLRAEITLDKEKYDLNTDKTAKISAKLHYRFPFVQKVEPDQEPTIRMFVSIDKATGDNKKQVLLADTIKFSDQKFATDTLKYEGSFDVDLTKMNPQHKIAESDTITAKISVFFNNEVQKTTTIPVKLIPVATTISHVEAEERNSSNWYTIDGSATAVPSRKGIYIRNNKKVLVK